MPALPPPFADYLAPSGFWAGEASFDLWYGTRVEEWYWVHLRRKGAHTMAFLLFDVEDDEEPEFELYDLTAAPVHGIRATFLNPALATLNRYEPSLPVVAIRLAPDQSYALTLPRHPITLPDLWLSDALQRLRAVLTPQWLIASTTAPYTRDQLRSLWPSWAGTGVMR